MNDDDPIVRAMRAADPALTPLDAPLAPRHMTILDRITTAPPSPRRTSVRVGPFAILAGLPLAAIIVIAMVATLATFNPAPAAANTPPPLEYTPIDASASAVLSTVEAALNEEASAQAAQRRSHSIGWYLDIRIGPSTRTVAIAPQESLTVWNEDLSGSTVHRAGKPYAAGADPTAPIPDDYPEPGTILTELTFGPGDFRTPTATPPGTTEDEMLAFLESYGDPHQPLEAGRLIRATQLAFNQWTLTNAHHAAILRLLGRAGDIEVLGEATDRAGRGVIGLRADYSVNPRYEFVLLISTDTGRIVGLESITKVAMSAQVPAGSVAGYTLWETGEMK